MSSFEEDIKKEKRRQYYLKNREKAIERATRWKKNNKERSLEISRKYHQKMRENKPEIVKERNKKIVFLTKEKMNSNKDYFIEKVFKQIFQGAKKRGIEFKLEFDQFKVLLESTETCSLSGRPVYFEVNNMDRISVDRIDNSKGYQFDNIQIVSSTINMLRNRLSIEDFVSICSEVVNFHKKKNKRK